MDHERPDYKDLSDDEKLERIKEMEEQAQALRERFTDEYYSIGDAIKEVKAADGGLEKTVAGTKLLGKVAFNVGKYSAAEIAPSILETTAKKAKKHLKYKAKMEQN